MNDLFMTLVELAQEHWLKVVTGAAFMGLGWFLGRFRARRSFERREFHDRLNVSLNIIQDGTLRIRTLLEKRCDEIFLNAAATDRVIRASQRTTPQDSLLPLPKDDYWYYLNSVLNEVSEMFAEGHLRRDLGLPVTSARYVLCLTSEASGALRMRKTRAMVIREDILTNLPAERPKLESDHHGTRWETLKELAKAYAKRPECFLRVELSL